MTEKSVFGRCPHCGMLSQFDLELKPMPTPLPADPDYFQLRLWSLNEYNGGRLTEYQVMTVQYLTGIPSADVWKILHYIRGVRFPKPVDGRKSFWQWWKT